MGRRAVEPPVPEQRRPHRWRLERQVTELQCGSPDHRLRDSPAERGHHVRLMQDGAGGQIGQAQRDASLGATGRE